MKRNSKGLLLLSTCILIASMPAYSGELLIQGLAPPRPSPQVVNDLTSKIQQLPSPELYKERAKHYRHLGNHKGAVEDLKQAINMQPNVAVNYVLKGEVFFDAGMFPEAIQDCNDAIQLDPKLVGAYALRMRSYVHLKDYSKALSLASQLFSLAPDSPTSYLLRGEAYQGLKKYGNALSDLNEAVKRDPNQFKAFYYRAKTYEGMGEFQKAHDDYTQALTLLPDYRPALLGRAWSNYNLDHDDEALADASKAVRFNNADPLKALNKYVGEKATLPEIDPDQKYYFGSELEADLKNALTLYDDILKTKPGDADALRDRGLVFMHLGKYRDADKDFLAANKGVQVKEDGFPGIGQETDYLKAKVEYESGNQELTKGDYGAAIDHYQAALKIYPAYGKAWHNMGYAAGELGDNFSAELCCIHALSYRPDDWKLWNTLGYNLYHEYQQDKGDPVKLQNAVSALSFSLSCKIDTESEREGVRHLLASVKAYERTLAPTNDFVITTMPVI